MPDSLNIPEHCTYAQLVDTLAAALQILPDKPEETPENTLRALWFRAAGAPRPVEACDDSERLPQLDSTQNRVLRDLIAQRLAGTPLAHLTGRQRFLGIDFQASAQALIPRKETEILGRAALELVRELVAERNRVVVLDVCTGSGNLALALAHHESRAKVYAADLSQEAVNLACSNAEFLQLTERTEFRSGDLLAPFAADLRGKVDLITCNPPYLSSAKLETLPSEIAKHEPSLAFDGGPFGVQILMRLIEQAPEFLKPASWLCFELGLGQGPALQKRLAKAAAFDALRSYTDARGAIRALAARTRSTHSTQ